MVAYSYKARFEPMLINGRKPHTIRADRKRHARPGEELQHYIGMRTRSCRLVMRSVCAVVHPIWINLIDNRIGIRIGNDPISYRIISSAKGLNRFAYSDGFEDWNDMHAFWRSNHPEIDRFSGVLIGWEPASIRAADPVIAA